METIRFIGINLGTTNTCVATIGPGGRPEIVPSRQGETVVPSVVTFARQGEPLVGTVGRRAGLANPGGSVAGVRRLLGRRWDDPAVERLRAGLSYSVVPGQNGDAWIELFGRRLSPPEVAAHILRAAHRSAQEYIGTAAPPVAVLTVPASFDQAQRQALKDAAEIAGIPVRRLLPESAAAALGAGAHLLPAAHLAVCDVGGGKVDVSIVAVEDGVLEVMACAGDSHLGGEDIDRRIAARLSAEIRASAGIDVEADPIALAKLKDEVQKAKHVLSESPQAAILVPQLLGADRPAYTRTLERGEVDSWVKDLVARLEGPCNDAMMAARLGPRDIDQLILAGGAVRMPAVQKKLAELFGRPPQKNLNPDELVAMGAARYCALLAGLLPGVALLPATSRTIGFSAGGGRFVPVVPRNATVPLRESRVITTTVDGQRELAIDVYEGDSPDLGRDRPFASFVLAGLPEAVAGEVLVMVDFTVDPDGLLSLGARELASGARAEIRARQATGLARADVRKLAGNVDR